jgi:RNA polymerase sigma-70 factor (ECF subfamily)
MEWGAVKQASPRGGLVPSSGLTIAALEADVEHAMLTAGMGDMASDDHDSSIERARTGDAAAWEKLIARHERRVLLVLLAKGVRASRAEEIVQETWMRLVAKSREGALERLELPGLAIAQATHLALDDARAQRLRHATSIEDAKEAEALVDPHSGALERMLSREALERALAELERCPPRARQVYSVLYENPDLAHAEAANKLGLSVQRVRQTLCDVRARLRAKMEQ